MVGRDNETGIRTIPPVVFMGGLVAAWILDRIVALPTGLPPLFRLSIGWAIVAATVAFILYLFFDFRGRGTEYRVEIVPKTLVTDGAFAFSRNPGYVAMVVGTLAFALITDTLWVVPAALASAWVLQARVIVKEEALLEREFGDDYRAYKSRVRRWL